MANYFYSLFKFCLFEEKYETGTIHNYDNLIGYNAYYEGVQLNSELIPADKDYKEYTVPNAEDGDYYVTAVYEQGESEPSNIVYVTFGPLPTPAVTDLSAKVENNVLTLTWSAPEGAGTHAVSALLGYYVYRDGIVLNPEGNLIWYDAELKYVVDPAVSGSYTVMALYFDGESEDSNVVVVDLSGISTVTESNNDGDFYTLHGVKVKKPIKGNIYIHNGKKVVF